MCVRVVTRLPQRLKPMIFEKKILHFSVEHSKFLHSSADPFGAVPIEKTSKNVNFIL